MLEKKKAFVSKRNCDNLQLMYKHNGEIIFNLDLSGDSPSFTCCEKYIRDNLSFKTIKYFPPIWDGGQFRFIFNDIEIELYYMDFGGTDLRVSENVGEEKISQVKLLAETLLKELKKSGLTDL